MPKKYRVAVIGRTGKGNYGHRLDVDWLHVDRAEVVAVADENERGRAQAAQRLHVDKAYADYRKMLDEVQPDIVSICPRWLDQHRDMAVAAAERGIHIYMEKPFCRNLLEADEIVAACEKTHAKLAIAHSTRYSPKLQAARRLIEQGAIGQVLELRGRGKEDRRGGGEDLWVLGSHVLDLFLAFGYSPQWCFASVLQNGEPLKKEHVGPGPEGIGLLAGDAVRAMYGLKEGMTASWQSYRGAGGGPSRFGLQIFGSRGILEIFTGQMPGVYILEDSSWSPGRTSKRWKPVSSAGIEQPEPLTAEKYKHHQTLGMENLLRSIEQQSEPLCGVYEGRRIVEMIAAVFESQRLGGPVSLPLETRENPLALL